ncbi:MAG: hypothetical protein AAGC72_02580 [Planctomycetota bacterium]
MATALGTASCAGRAPIEDRKVSRDFQYISTELDSVAKHLEEWGTLSISGPLVTESSTPFHFDPKVTDRELFDAGRLEGKSATRQAQAVKAGASVSVDPTGGAAAVADAATETASTASDGQGVSPPGRPENTAEETVGPFSPELQLAEDELAMRMSHRIRAAASNKFELGLHQLLSKPGGLTRDQSIYYFVTTVACRPGWRTNEGYAGYVDGRLKYTIDGDRLAGSDPLIVAVYPAFETQDLNLRSSYRRLLAIAGEFAAAGNTAGATAFLEAAERVEQDAETVSSLAQLTSYSSGRNFGLEFRPAFRALANPDQRKAKPGFKLESVSLPIVAIVVVDWNEVKKLEAIRKRTEAGQLFSSRVRAEALNKLLPAKLTGQLYQTQREAITQSQAAVGAAEAKARGAETSLKVALQARDSSWTSLTSLSRERVDLEMKLRAALAEDDTQAAATIKQQMNALAGVLDNARQAFESAEKKVHKNTKAVADASTNITKARRAYWVSLDEAWIKVIAHVEDNDQRITKQQLDEAIADAGDALNLRLRTGLEPKLAAALDKQAQQIVEQMVTVDLDVTHGWRPIDPPLLHDIPVVEQIGRPFQFRRYEQSVAAQANRLYRAWNRIDTLKAELSGTNGDTRAAFASLDKLRWRWNTLQSDAINLTSFVAIRLNSKKEAPLTVADVYPKEVDLRLASSFLIKGTGFIKKSGSSVEKATASIASKIATINTEVISDKLIRVEVPAGTFNKTMTTAFEVTIAKTKAFTPPITFRESDKNVQITIQRQGEHITSVTMPDTPQGAQMFGRLLRVLRDGNASDEPKQKADVRIDVEAERQP